jgi:hypothetical protein
MDASQFAAMSARWQGACRAALAESALILIHTRPNSIGRSGERAAILCDDVGLRGWLPVELAGGLEATVGLRGDLTQTLATTGREWAEDDDEDDDQD